MIIISKRFRSICSITSLVAVSLQCLLVSGCGGPGTSNSTAEIVEQAVGSRQQRAISVDSRVASDSLGNSESGKIKYEALCQSCHGVQGEGGIGPVLSFDCASCSTPDFLAQRISLDMGGVPSNCEGQCAVDVASFLATSFFSRQQKSHELQLQNQAGQALPEVAAIVPSVEKPITAANSTVAGEAVDSSNQLPSANNDVVPLSTVQLPAAALVDKIEKLSAQKTLRKAALQLARRLPSTAEISVVSAAGEAGLSRALDSLLSEPAFCRDFMMDLYNEKLRTDLYRPREKFGNAARLFLMEDLFPEREWYEEVYTKKEQRQQLEAARYQTREALARLPLELVAEVVCKNKPFTEILTADYIMVNPYSARSMGVFDRLQFKDETDPSEFKPARLSNNPQAGILSSFPFLYRYPSTETNLNRARAYRTYLYFLDTDILLFQGDRDSVSDDLSDADAPPEVSNPNCMGCHELLDPIARLFFNRNFSGGLYTFEKGESEFYQERPSMFAPGFNGKVFPESEAAKALPWLASEITRDPRFARSVVKTVLSGLLQRPLFQLPQDPSDAESNIFWEQQSYITRHTEVFIASGYKMKDLVKSLVLDNPYYRSVNQSSSCTEAVCDQVGHANIKYPEALSDILVNVSGLQWTGDIFAEQLPLLEHSMRSFYAGIDNNAVDASRADQPNGLMASVQDQMSIEMGCFLAARDFFKTKKSDRRFLTLVSMADNPESPLIKPQIKALMDQLLGEGVSQDPVEVEAVYQIFLKTWKIGQKRLASGKYEDRAFSCPIRKNPETLKRLDKTEYFETDDDYTVRAWAAVLTYFLQDYQFLYQE